MKQKTYIFINRNKVLPCHFFKSINLAIVLSGKGIVSSNRFDKFLSCGIEAELTPKFCMLVLSSMDCSLRIRNIYIIPRDISIDIMISGYNENSAVGASGSLP